MTKQLAELPSPPAPLGIYVCGITPYDRPHLGHARSAVIYDGLVRYLRHMSRQVTYVRNITDIDDKIIERCGSEDLGAFVAKYTDEYHQLLHSLGCLSPDFEPRVTEHIAEIIAFIQSLEDSGMAYQSGGSVYFNVRGAEEYGRLSNRSLEELSDAPAADSGNEKRDPLDFALWKSAKPLESPGSPVAPSWPSPWGNGRPGWHIECSAMSMKYLGETFDIHGGGNDLLFPHHENERAQSMAKTGAEQTRIWMHNGLITMNKTKMSKSLGNVAPAAELCEKYGADILRFYFLSVHYASPLEFSLERLDETARSLERFSVFGADVSDEVRDTEQAAEIERKFLDALSDDFNTARAFAVLFEAVRDAEPLSASTRSAVRGGIAKAGEILGIRFFSRESLSVEVRMLLEQRASARDKKDFAESDRLRKLLSNMGIIVEDTPSGQRWRK